MRGINPSATTGRQWPTATALPSASSVRFLVDDFRRASPALCSGRSGHLRSSDGTGRRLCGAGHIHSTRKSGDANRLGGGIRRPRAIYVPGSRSGFIHADGFARGISNLRTSGYFEAARGAERHAGSRGARDLRIRFCHGARRIDGCRLFARLHDVRSCLRRGTSAGPAEQPSRYDRGQRSRHDSQP